MDSTDPLLFTCEFHNVFALRIMLPNGYKQAVSNGSKAEKLNLPVGFKAVSLNTTQKEDFTRYISLTLSIANASLLDGGEIICDDANPINNLTAGCVVCGKF